MQDDHGDACGGGTVVVGVDRFSCALTPMIETAGTVSLRLLVVDGLPRKRLRMSSWQSAVENQGREEVSH